MGDVFTYVVDFRETGVHEMVTCNEDGCYSVFLNARDSSEQQKKSYCHAMKHITGDDFYRDDLTVDEIEALRHAD